MTNLATGIRETVSDAAEQVRKGLVSTYDAEKNSIDNSIDSIKGAGETGLESAAKVIKTGLNGFLLPLNFLRNTLVNTNTGSNN